MGRSREGRAVGAGCSICGQPVLAGEARYTVTENHYDCEFPDGYKSPTEQFEELDKKVGAIFESFGIQRKRLQSPLGSGGPTRKLSETIAASAKDHFDTQDIGEIKIHLAPPVWRQLRFDVQRLEGSMRVNGKLVLFGSWCTVTELNRFKRVRFDARATDLEISPDRDAPRARSKSTC